MAAGLGAVAGALGELGADAGLSAVAVGTGPGSYTGLRVALSYAKAMATAATLPLTSRYRPTTSWKASSGGSPARGGHLAAQRA